MKCIIRRRETVRRFNINILGYYDQQDRTLKSNEKKVTISERDEKQIAGQKGFSQIDRTCHGLLKPM